MGASVRTKYETEKGSVVNIRIGLSASTLTGNPAPTGALTDDAIWAFASNPGSRRKKALNARGLILERFTGTGVNRKRFTTFLPVLTKASWNTYAVNAELTVNTVVYTIASKVGEA